MEESFISRVAKLTKMPEEAVRQEIKDIVRSCESEKKARDARARLLLDDDTAML